MNLPHEVYVYILSFLDKKYETLYCHGKTRCLAYTQDSGYRYKCKYKTRFYFCHLHRNLPIYKTLYCIQPPIVRNKHIKYFS